MSEKNFETVKVALPEEDYVYIEFTQNEMPGKAIINQSLKTFEHKPVFAWHLSLMVIYKDHIEDKMPSKAEQEVLFEFEKTLDEKIKANNNALFLASITHDGNRELIWRVYHPHTANDIIYDVIETEDHPRPFDFTLEEDKEWIKAKWHLDALDSKEKPQPE